MCSDKFMLKFSCCRLEPCWSLLIYHLHPLKQPFGGLLSVFVHASQHSLPLYTFTFLCMFGVSRREHTSLISPSSINNKMKKWLWNNKISSESKIEFKCRHKFHVPLIRLFVIILFNIYLVIQFGACKIIVKMTWG